MAFWLCILAIVLCGPMITGFQSFAAAYWQSGGMEAVTSSNYVSMFSAIGSISVIVLGQVASKKGNKLFISIIMISYIIGMGFQIAWSSNPTTLICLLAVAFVGFAYPASTSIPATLTTESFGTKDYTKITAQFSAALYFGKAIASPLIGRIQTITGSYTGAFICCTILAAIALVMILIAIHTSPMAKINRANAVKI